MEARRPGLVRSICVEATQNPELSERFGVSSVPHNLLNEDVATSSVGAQPENRGVRQVAMAGAPDAAAVEVLEASLKASAGSFPDAPDHPVEVTDGSCPVVCCKD